MTWKTIRISEKNYNKLASYGNIGNSFNEAISKLISQTEEILKNE
jgi:predicted CopG family antitoxin